jgi:hypothetical protein
MVLTQYIKAAQEAKGQDDQISNGSPAIMERFGEKTYLVSQEQVKEKSSRIRGGRSSEPRQPIGIYEYWEANECGLRAGTWSSTGTAKPTTHREAPAAAMTRGHV